MTDALFYLKKLVSLLVLPPAAPLILLMLGLLLLRKRPRLGQLTAWAGAVALLLCSLPATSQFLGNLVLVPSGLFSEPAGRVQAVVVLGGGRQSAAEYGGETVSARTLERVRYGAKLAKERQLPLLLSGGTAFRGAPESELMDRVLRDSFTMSAQWLERRSRDTRQNAMYSAQMLKAAGIRTVLLVTHDIHQRRSLGEFTAAGLEPVSAPVTMLSPHSEVTLLNQLPSSRAFALNALLLHELLGNVVLWSRGAI